MDQPGKVVLALLHTNYIPQMSIISGHMKHTLVWHSLTGWFRFGSQHSCWDVMQYPTEMFFFQGPTLLARDGAMTMESSLIFPLRSWIWLPSAGVPELFSGQRIFQHLPTHLCPPRLRGCLLYCASARPGERFNVCVWLSLKTLLGYNYI